MAIMRRAGNAQWHPLRGFSISVLLTLVSSHAVAEYRWALPPWIAPPPVPADNPMSDDKVELGRRLFYDIRISGPGYMSCASCHQLERALTDGRPVAVGVTGERHTLNTPQIANVGYQSTLTAGDPTVRSLEQHAHRPLFGTKPVEMGAAGYEQQILLHIESNPTYVDLFRRSFPVAQGRIDFEHIAAALAAFQRTLISASSPYDRYRYAGETNAISDAAKRGEALFFGPRLGCGRCHAGLHLTDAIPEAAYRNTGLYNVDGDGALPAGNRGLAESTGRAEDIGRFKTPSLRNIALTAPYMHDGSLATLATSSIIMRQVAVRRARAGVRRSPRR